MNKIVFFTSCFPFRTVFENFFESELFGVAQDFDKVYIVSCDLGDKKPKIKKDLPENATAIPIKRKKFIYELILGVVCLPFKGFFWRELKNIIKGKYPFIASFKSMVYQGVYHLAICRHFPEISKKMDLSPKDNIVLAGYWLHYLSEVALSFKKFLKLKDAKVISRAHGSADIQNITNPKKYYPFQAHLLSELDGVYAVSEKGRDYLCSISDRPEKIETVYIGSDGPSAPIVRSRSPFTVVSCSNIIPLKRVWLISEAIRILSRDIKDISWVHFGDGPQRNALETACSDIQAYVDFRGYTEHRDVISYLANGSASVFVSASSTEGLPISVIEAIAHSIPVIATDVGATNEAVSTDISGNLVSPDISAKKLSEYIRKIYAMDSAEYRALSESTFDLWQKKFDCRKNSKIFSESLKQL